MSTIISNIYTINGVIDTGKSVLENMNLIAEAAGCWMTYDIHQGKWAVVINSTGSSVASFNDTNIIGGINLSSTSLTEVYNSVEMEFPHKDLRDETDYIKLSVAAGDRYPNEPDNVLSINSQLINNPIQAQAIAGRQLKQSRIDKVISFTTDWSKIGLKAGDLIDITNTAYGFSSKVFRIISIEEADEDDGTIVVNITALEYDANVYNNSGLVYNTRTRNNGITNKSVNSTLNSQDSGIAPVANIAAQSAIIKFTYQDGTDLDTRTRIYSPDLGQYTVDNFLGWTGATSQQFWPNGSNLSTAIISWGGDNTGPGGDANAVESIFVNITRFKTLYPNAQYLVVECRGNWFGTKGKLPVKVTADLYVGGTLGQVGYAFQVTNATQTASIPGLDVYVTSEGQGGNETGNLMGYLVIDTLNATAQFRNDILKI